MNQPFRLLFLASACVTSGWLTACQSESKPVAAASLPPAAASAPTKTEDDQPTQPATTASTTVVGPAIQNVPAFLAANNLAPLWQADFDRQEAGARPLILDGFYGADHRHIAVIFERVEPDTRQPGLFRVHGRTRYKKNITPFDGTLTVTGLKALNVPLDLDSATQARARAYTATTSFELREDATAAGAGIFRGTALMDFYRLSSGELGLVQEMSGSDLPTGGGGLLFRGNWQSVRTGRQQEVAFATYAQAVVPDAMQDLYIGERGETINPKYAGLDWSEAWENEEWWAKPTKPALSL
jgi:hypothetical protein